MAEHEGMEWAEELVRAPQDPADRHGRVAGLSRDRRGAGLSGDALHSLIAAALRARPDLVQAWQTYSWDKRWSPSPYLDGDVVGLYDGGPRDVEQHPDAVRACAAFVAREVEWLRTRT